MSEAKAQTSTTPHTLGIDAGVAYCMAAANDGMDRNPYPAGTKDAEDWQSGFDVGVTIWEERWS